MKNPEYALVDIETTGSNASDYLTPYRSNQYIMQLIHAFTKKYPHKIIRNQAFSKALVGE